MSALTDRIAQQVWQAYVVEMGRSMPAGLADAMAVLIEDGLQLTVLMDHLRIEGSDLLIQMASEHNLNWTWRVRYNNGKTGQSTTRTGASLPQALDELLAAWSEVES